MTSARFPYQDPNLPPAERARDLVGRMSVREKIGQLNQVRAEPSESETVCALARDGLVGSRILASTAWAGNETQHVASIEDGNRVQRIAVEESRLGVPILNGRDVIHGHRTVFPIPLGQAASFDPALVEEAASHAAAEASAYGVHWTFAPMLDVARDARWGRIVEGCGEDPYLTGVMGAAMVRGFQGPDPSQPGRILACAKHYVAYGTSEGGRDYASGECSDHTLRNVYLEPFRAAVRAGCATIMSAFHDINGEPVSGSRYLLSELLKGELGFQGFVVSDWASVTELIAHGVAENEADAAAQALSAGVDMEMVSGAYVAHLESLLERRRVEPARLDDAAARVLCAKFRKGLFERPYVDAERAASTLLSPAARACARKLAARSLVLLKNQGNCLPLAGQGKIAVVGPLASARAELMGSWVLDGLAEDVTSVVDALREAAPKAGVITAPPLLDAAVAAAQRADVTVLVLGESPLRTGEAHNIADLALPRDQDAWVEALARTGTPLVVVICAGRPLPIAHVVANAAAVLYAWHPGTEGGRAIAEVLIGAEAPSGRLPATLPRAQGQVPIFYAHKHGGRGVNRYYPFAKPDHPGIRPYLDDLGSPLFPFGFGLSYSTFAYDELSLDRSELPRDGTLKVSARVSNTGPRHAEEVAQCYVRDFVGSVTRPLRELRGFRRIPLAPGASARVEFELGPEELAFWNGSRQRLVEPGRFAVYVGSDSFTELGREFQVR
ncbi:MAG TPA: glycoside hydrolase family 3 N-terminal domain-containing protein [Polyangiaceae bacterium]|nr:glycoside hydrolase family 3 N-terminal domain-containing protein [Polyangiaceae bacterium]